MIYEEKKFGELEYLIAYPNNFNNEKKYPVLFHFHGAGTRNTSFEHLKTCLIFPTIDKHELEFIVVAPLCCRETWFDYFETLKGLVKEITEHKNADPDHFYIMGASMGGYATWQLAISIPEYFAAIVPVCGGGMYWDTGRLKNMGVWAFHGALDITVRPEESQKMVDGVNKRGGNAKLTIYPDVEHASWIDTYTNPEVYKWMLSYKKSDCNTSSDNFNNVAKYG